MKQGGWGRQGGHGRLPPPPACKAFGERFCMLSSEVAHRSGSIASCIRAARQGASGKSGRWRTAHGRLAGANQKLASSGSRSASIPLYVESVVWSKDSSSQQDPTSPTRRSPPGGGARRGRVPQPAVAENLLDHGPLRRLDKGDHLHRAAALRTGQRVHLEEQDMYDSLAEALTAHQASRSPAAAAS